MPNAAHLHLILNHFPVIGSGIVLFILLYGILNKNEKIVRTGLLLLILISLITIPVFISGSQAEGIIKGLEGVNEDKIEPHEEFAKFSFIAMEITGGLSLFLLLLHRKEKQIPLNMKVIVFILILAVCGMMIYTAHLGGKITHYELMQSGKTMNKP